MSFGKILTLNTGEKIPQIGLGTWLSKPKEVESAVRFNRTRLVGWVSDVQFDSRLKSPSATTTATSISHGCTKTKTRSELLSRKSSPLL